MTVAIAERDLQQAVIETARLLGWRVAHFRPARTKHGWATPVAADGKGFPDLVLVHRDRGVIFAELKAGRGKLTAEQVEWINELHLALWESRPRVDVFVWTPEHWPERITEVLAGRKVVAAA